jgi:hypothetical protein
VPPDQWLAEDLYREQSGSFPYVDLTPQYTPHPSSGRRLWFAKGKGFSSHVKWL